MNANPKFLNVAAHVDEAAVKPLPNSRKVYVEGSRPDIRVPMREITQSDTPAAMGAEKNPAIFVYDTSGPYTDPGVKIDIRSGLAPTDQVIINGLVRARPGAKVTPQPGKIEAVATAH